jgi:hypothetical protein
MGAFQSYERSAAKREMVINNVVYDITDFAKRHPGTNITDNRWKYHPRPIGTPKPTISERCYNHL